LIELMISIAIGLVVVGAVSYLYLGSRGAYRGNESLARIQEAGRFALDSITRDIRRSGALGCGSRVSVATGGPITVTVVPPLALAAEAIQGFKPANYTPLPTAPPSALNPTIAPMYWGGDVLQLQIASGAPVRVVNNPDTTNGRVTIADNSVALFGAGDYALLGDCSAATVFKVLSASTTTSGAAATIGFGAGASLGGDGFTIDNRATLQHFDQITYFVGKVPSTGRSALYRYSLQDASAGRPTPEELVENIEDMDVVYGVDTSPGDNVLSADEFDHADLVGAWANVASVRVSVLAAGDQQGVGSQGQTLPFRGTTTAPAGDTRLRQVFTATAAVRDRVK